MATATTGWHLVAVILCASAVFCVPVDETTVATVITESDQSFGQTDVSGEVGPTVSDDGVKSNVVRRRNGVEMAEEVREEPSSRERLVLQSLGLQCKGGDVLSCFMVELTNYFDGFMARSNADPLPGDNLTQVSSPQGEPPSSSAEEPSAGSRSGEDSVPPPPASLLQLVGRKAWEVARSYVLSLDLRPVADFVQEVRTRGLLSGLEKAIAAGRSEKLTGGGIDFSQISQLSSQLPQFPQFGNNDGGNSDDDDDDDDDEDNDNDKDNSSQSTMTAIVLKTVVLGALAMKAIALLVVKVLVIMKVTAAVAVLALLFFHGFQKDISYQVVTHQKQPPPDSYEPDPHSHQEEYGGDSYSNSVGGGGYGGGGGGGGYGGNGGGGYGGNGGGGYGGGNGGGGNGGDWNRNGAAHNLAYRGQRRKQTG